MSPAQVTISKSEYQSLLNSQEMLNSLKEKIGEKEVELGQTFEINSPDDLDVLVKEMV